MSHDSATAPALASYTASNFPGRLREAMSSGSSSFHPERFNFRHAPQFARRHAVAFSASAPRLGVDGELARAESRLDGLFGSIRHRTRRSSLMTLSPRTLRIPLLRRAIRSRASPAASTTTGAIATAPHIRLGCVVISLEVRTPDAKPCPEPAMTLAAEGRAGERLDRGSRSRGNFIGSSPRAWARPKTTEGEIPEQAGKGQQQFRRGSDSRFSGPLADSTGRCRRAGPRRWPRAGH